MVSQGMQEERRTVYGPATLGYNPGMDRLPDSPGILNRIQQIRGQAEQLVAMAEGLRERLAPISVQSTPMQTEPLHGTLNVKSNIVPSPTSNELDAISNILIRVEQSLREINQVLDF
jgi:hypothetical protein